MFNLSRYFSILSFILIALAATALGMLYRKLSLQEMHMLAQNGNVAMAEIFRNSLEVPFEALVRDSRGRDGNHLRRIEASNHLQTAARNLMRHTAVIRVKLYGPDGTALFSTDPQQIGQVEEGDVDLQAAMAGRVVSELRHQDTFSGLDVEYRDVDVLSSYIPVMRKDKAVIGILELYQDVTPFVARLHRGLWMLTAAVLAVFAALYFMQYLVVRRAQRILREQENRLKASRDNLELEVASRTEELKSSNLKLQAEIGERRAIQSRLNYLAYHDPLTGLFNRTTFLERLEERIERAKASGGCVAILYVDLDQFKQVNDSLGHNVGDELLVAVAARLSANARAADLLARVGGDEFIYLMDTPCAEDVTQVANRLIRALDQPFRIEEHELFLSATVGIALSPGDGEKVEDVMRNADTAMYRAKLLGRGNYLFYSPEMTRQARERIRMENLLRRANEYGELAIHFQPQVDTASGKLIGAEALMRWTSPDVGEISPNQFIPLAEDSGLVVGLGEWVLRESCRLFVEWQKQGFSLPSLSVNVSIKQLERIDFIDMVDRIIRETGMPPGSLTLELTETVVLKVGNASEVLGKLRERNISLALDDFGIGYSSLSYLKTLPVQQLKIDQTFVRGIGANPRDEAVVRAIVEMARSLGFEVVAEGVEDQIQGNFLREVGCDYLQGNLHGKPLPAEDFFKTWSRSA